MPLEIAPEKVAHVIVRAREYDARVDVWNTDNDEDAGSEESSTDQGLHDELTAFIDALNDDEQTQLVALCWVGRGTYDPEDFDEALETAQRERVNSVAAYLLGQPLLADYLEEGLDRMGVSVEDAESDVL
ncbi:MAG TPA: DUF3775 domain-containing protein [Hyphomicrobiaceae bacterium]|nr:DUF3775 domain-containing protein [Hyphomicrobiaceae bacterium]